MQLKEEDRVSVWYPSNIYCTSKLGELTNIKGRAGKSVVENGVQLIEEEQLIEIGIVKGHRANTVCHKEALPFAEADLSRLAFVV